jgi:hypothetical protein
VSSCIFMFRKAKVRGSSSVSLQVLTGMEQGFSDLLQNTLSVLKACGCMHQSPWEAIVAQLVKNLPNCSGARNFITAFRRVRHWILYWAKWIQSTPSHLNSLRLTLILSSHVRLGQNISYLQVYCRKSFMYYLSFPCVLQAPLISFLIWSP